MTISNSTSPFPNTGSQFDSTRSNDYSIVNTPIRIDPLPKQATTTELLVNYPSTLEHMIDSPVRAFEAEPQVEPILLAQSGEFIPDVIRRDLQQQLQPIGNKINDALAIEPNQPGQAALDLITEHRDIIIAEADRAGVEPQHVASIIFQEKMHGGWAAAKNVAFAWPQVLTGQNDASIGLAEMDINTAARIMGIDSESMTAQQRDFIIETLVDDKSAIGLIADNIAHFETRLGRDVSLKEATHGHNMGVDQLVRDLPIERGSATSRRSWPHQNAIAKALQLQ